MADGRGTVREIIWQDICPGLLLLRTFRIAIKARVLVLAMAGLLAWVAGYQLIGWLFSGTENLALKDWIETQEPWPWRSSALRGASVLAGDESLGPVGDLDDRLKDFADYPVFDVWRRISAPFFILFGANASVPGLAYSLLACLWTAAVWSLFGGAITRIAAVALAREEHVDLREALRFAWGKFGSYFFAPISPLAAILVAMLLLLIPSLLIRTGFGLFLAGLLWPILLVIGFLFALLLLGVWFGWPLMWPAVSTETQSDAFEALNRSYAYVYQRPLYLLILAMAAGLLGLLGAVIVYLFAYIVLHFSYVAVSWGAGPERLLEIRELVNGAGADEVGWFTSAGASLIAFWQALVITLAVAFQFAFFWVAVEAIYLLLRRSVDATEIDQVFLEDEQAYGLPHLETDAAGVPGAPEGITVANDDDAPRSPGEIAPPALPPED